MKRILLAVLCLLGCLLVAPGCSHTPHLYNPVHWVVHVGKIFNPRDGELHTLHVDLDRIVLGVENYEELETTEYVYSE